MDDYYLDETGNLIESLRGEIEPHEPLVESLSDFLQNKEENSHLINISGTDSTPCLKSLYSLLRFRLPSIFVSTLDELHESFVKNLSINNSEHDLFIINLEELSVPSDYLKLVELLGDEYNHKKSTYKLILVRTENLNYKPINVDSQSNY